MPTKNPRVNVVLEEPLYEELSWANARVFRFRRRSETLFR